MKISDAEIATRRLTFRILMFLSCFALLNVLLAGCASTNALLSVPGIPLNPAMSESQNRNNTLCIDYRTVRIDRYSGDVTCDIRRDAADALNILGFLEPPALHDLRIDFSTLHVDGDAGLVTVDVIIRHPLLSGEKRFNGFDVRGIVFGPELLNADGYIRWLNPSEFSDVPLGYKDGMLGTVGDWEDFPLRFNGYKYFAGGIEQVQAVDDFFMEPANVSLRGVFQEGTEVRRRYELSWDETSSLVDFFVFTYAVYASYRFPKGQPPYGLDAFSLSANSHEAIFARILENKNTLYYNDGDSGGGIDFDIEVFDWQGAGSTYSASIKSVEPGLLPETDLSFIEIASPHSAIFNIAADIQPITSAGLELLITCSDGTTYGEAYIASLMPEEHPLHDKPIVVKFPYTADVSVLPEGINIISSGQLPDPQPITDERDFCVVTGNPYTEGVYYFGHIAPIPPDTQPGGIFRYPLDYSDDGSPYYNMHSTIEGYDDYDLWGDQSDLGALDIVSAGAGMFTSISANASGFLPYLHRDIAFWFDTAPIIRNGITCPKGHGVLKWIDVSASYITGTGGRIIGIAITDELLKDTYPPVVGTEIGMVTVFSPYYYYDTRFNRSMFEKDTLGDVDGKVDDEHASAVAFDGSPLGLTHQWTNSVVYILESDDTPSIEVFEINAMNEDGTTLTYPITTIHGFEDQAVFPIDLECFPAVSLGLCDDFNWVAVLEDAGDESWSVSMWAQDGSFVARSDAADGAPLHLDIEGESGKIHVWYESGGTVNYAMMEYLDL